MFGKIILSIGTLNTKKLYSVSLVARTSFFLTHLCNCFSNFPFKVEEAARKHRQRVVDFIRVTCRLGQDFSEEEVRNINMKMIFYRKMSFFFIQVHHVLGILGVNSFVVHDTDEGNLDLIGLYPWTSLMSHHCTANTKITTTDDFT